MKLLSLERLKSIKLKDLFSPSIVRLIWSAILDEKVCDYCRSRDGMIIESTDPEYTIYMPPAHPNCRCHWVNVTSDADVIPERSWVDPQPSFYKYIPFLFLIPDKEKNKNKVLPIDDMWYSNEAPELFFNTKDVLSI